MKPTRRSCAGCARCERFALRLFRAAAPQTSDLLQGWHAACQTPAVTRTRHRISSASFLSLALGALRAAAQSMSEGAPEVPKVVAYVPPSVNDVHEARTLTRKSFGVMAGVAKIESDVPAQVYALELGVRQQLLPGFGVSAHLDFGMGAYSSSGRKGKLDSMYVDVRGNLAPYLGPFGRFYVGPALVLGHRHFSGQSPSTGGQSLTVTGRTRIEVGTRLGVLLGSREQFESRPERRKCIKL